MTTSHRLDCCQLAESRSGVFQEFEWREILKKPERMWSRETDRLNYFTLETAHDAGQLEGRAVSMRWRAGGRRQRLASCAAEKSHVGRGEGQDNSESSFPILSLTRQDKEGG
eukprot:599596-Hanusia_phi.AAC.1